MVHAAKSNVRLKGKSERNVRSQSGRKTAVSCTVSRKAQQKRCQSSLNVSIKKAFCVEQHEHANISTLIPDLTLEPGAAAVYPGGTLSFQTS